MSLQADLANLRNFPAGHRRVAFEAVVALAAARLAVTLLPFRIAAKAFGLAPADPRDADPREDEAVDVVCWAIAGTAARMPWNSTCLVRALAGAALLQRRRLGGMLYLGVSRAPAGGGTIAAHAWLSSGGTILTGGAERPQFTPVAAFRIARR